MDIQLNVLEQQPGLNLYTQLCFCFSVDYASLYPAINSTLENGLVRLATSFPWIAGQIVKEGASSIFKIKPFYKTPQLAVKDLRNEASMPSMQSLKEAGFPFSMLDETIIASRRTIPGTSGEEIAESTPVFLVQANIITGGLLLTFLGHHQAMDMTGQGHVIDLFSKACRNEQFTSEELSFSNPDRHNIIPLLDKPYEPGPELFNQLVQPLVSESASSVQPDDSPVCTWVYFSFNHTSLKALKALTSDTVTHPPGFISTDDALTAFLWQSVTRARLPRLDAMTDSTLARAVDVRRYLDIPQAYPGLAQNMTYHKYTVQELVEEPLGRVASQLRLAVDIKTSNLGYSSRALATVLSCSTDKDIISFTATIDASKDIMLSSWANVNCCGLDFNLGLGLPEAVRRPKFIPVESLVYLMPKTLDGEIVVGVCLSDADMERLRGDTEFTRYGTYIG